MSEEMKSDSMSIRIMIDAFVFAKYAVQGTDSQGEAIERIKNEVRSATTQLVCLDRLFTLF